MNKVSRAMRNIFADRGSVVAYPTISLLFTIIPDECLLFLVINNKWSNAINVLLNKLILCAVVLLICKVIIAMIRRFQKKISLKWDNYKVVVEYGNINKISGGMRVIHFDECFTTKLGDAPGEIKEGTICGQYLIRNKDLNIDEIIHAAKIKPYRGKSAYKGQTKYEPGTAVQYKGDMLMAFAKLDENGRAYMTYEDYLMCLNRMWEEINRYHGTKDVYIPVLGSLLTRLDRPLSQQQLVDTIIDSYRLSPYKLKSPFELHIICKPREDFKLSNVWGAK